MPPHRDRLEHTLEPLKAEAELNYIALGSAITEIAYNNSAVRRIHGLRITPPSELQRGVAWQRNKRNFVLLERTPPGDHWPAIYQFNQWNIGEQTEGDEPEVALAKSYVFGSSEVAAGGLVLVTAITGKMEYSAKNFLREAWRRGRITDDLTRIRRRPATQAEKTGFRRSIFSILERQKPLRDKV